jgi:hypothetical protein
MTITFLIVSGLLMLTSWIWMISILSKEGYEEDKIVFNRQYLFLAIPTMIALIIGTKDKKVKGKYLTLLILSILSVIGFLTFFFITISR